MSSLPHGKTAWQLLAAENTMLLQLVKISGIMDPTLTPPLCLPACLCHLSLSLSGVYGVIVLLCCCVVCLFGFLCLPFCAFAFALPFLKFTMPCLFFISFFLQTELDRRPLNRRQGDTAALQPLFQSFPFFIHPCLHAFLCSCYLRRIPPILM